MARAARPVVVAPKTPKTPSSNGRLHEAPVKVPSMRNATLDRLMNEAVQVCGGF